MFIVYLIAFYVVINLAGILIEKIKIPKIYAALFIGVLLSETKPVLDVVGTDPVRYLSQAGMFALLFLLGYGLDIRKIRNQGKIILRVTIAVILSESLVGISILHFFFGVDWALATVIAVSFATVGEVALLPLLKEFKLLKTNLGQTILGVAILDDIVEILAFVLLLTVFSGLNTGDLVNQILPLVAIVLGVLFGRATNFNHEEPNKVGNIINFLALYVFGPIFFFTAGAEANLHVLFKDFFLILLFTLAIKITKISSAYLVSHKQIGNKKAIVLGVSLGIKFSTSIVILILLLQKKLITEELFSVLIGIKVLFKFIVPIVLSNLLSRWQLDLVKPHSVKN